MDAANPKSDLPRQSQATAGIRNPKSGLPRQPDAPAEVTLPESGLPQPSDGNNPKSKIQNPKSPGVFVPHQAKWHQRLAAWLIYVFIQCLGATIRFKLNDQSGFFSGAPKEKFIFAIWHNRLALCLLLYRRYVARPAPEHRMAAMVSASKDGGLLARILELFGVEPVRGSSSRRGPRALRELIAWGERGYDLAITPDGPRGPCYSVQEGVISTAQITGLSIVPVAYHLNCSGLANHPG